MRGSHARRHGIFATRRDVPKTGQSSEEPSTQEATRLGRVLINPTLQARLAKCPHRRVGSSDRSVNIGHFIFSHFALENAEQTKRHQAALSALPPKADKAQTFWHDRFVPVAS